MDTGRGDRPGRVRPRPVRRRDAAVRRPFDPPIVGIPLDGRPGVAEIKDTDGGKWDGDTTYDRAVGPMQFSPAAGATFGVDGDGDGKIDPFDIDDATVGREVTCAGPAAAT